MRKPAMPHNERARLEAVQRLNLLDTPAEERFDRYTRLTQRVFDVPAAAISLISRRRQWFLLGGAGLRGNRARRRACPPSAGVFFLVSPRYTLAAPRIVAPDLRWNLND